ncbi:hypothetical protein ACC713_38370, partial [Rhizobium johnstonii]
GQYDVLTIGTYEVPIWAKQGWLVPLDNLVANYDVDDLLPAIRSARRAGILHQLDVEVERVLPFGLIELRLTIFIEP